MAKLSIVFFCNSYQRDKILVLNVTEFYISWFHGIFRHYLFHRDNVACYQPLIKSYFIP